MRKITLYFADCTNKLRGCIYKRRLEAPLRVSLLQPLGWVDLHAIHPDLPVQVSARHAPGASYHADDLSLLDLVTDIDEHLRLVPKSAVDAPAVIDDGCIPANGEGSGKYNTSRCGCKDLQSLPSTKVQSRVEAFKLDIGIDDFIGTPSAIS